MKLILKNKKKIFGSLFVLIYAFSLNLSFAAGLVPTCTGGVLNASTGERICTLCDLLQLGKNLITWFMQISVALAVVFIIYGGFVIMTAGGSPEKVKKGRQSITISVIGIVIALGAWLLIGTVLNIVTGSPSALPWTTIQCSI